MSELSPMRREGGGAAQPRDPLLREIIAPLWAGRWKIAAAVSVGMGVAFLHLLTADRAYTARAALQLDLTEEGVLDVANIVRGAQSEQVRLSDEIERLGSRAVVGRVVDGLDMTRDPEFNGALRSPGLIGGLKSAVKGVLCTTTGAIGCGADASEEVLVGGLYAAAPDDPVRAGVIDAVRDGLSAEPVDGTFHVAVAFTSEDPAKAALIANAVVDAFLEDRVDAERARLDDAVAYLEDQATGLRDRLETAGEELERFRAEAGVIPETGVSQVSGRLIDARERREAAERERETRDAELEAARAALAAGDASGAAEALGSQLALGLASEARALRRRAEAGDAAARRQLPAALAELEETVDAQIAQRVRSVGSLKARIASLDGIVALLEADAERQSRQSVRAQRLAEEVEATRATYQTVLLRLRELSVERALQTGGGRVTSPAVTPDGPSSPKTMLTVALGVFAGLVIGLGWTILAEHLNRGLRTRADLTRAVGAPALGAVPMIRARAISRAFLRDLGRNGGSGVGEALRSLRTFLALHALNRAEPQAIAVTSSAAGEGKSTTTLLLAAVLAAGDSKVVVVDADLRHPTLRRLAPSRGQKGLRALLTGAATLAEAVLTRDDLDFDMVLAEPGSENAADLLAGPRLGQLIAELKTRYDIVLIDCPPVLPVADARVIAPRVDGVLFAARWNATSERMVEEAATALHELGAPLVGAFYTQVAEADYARFEFGYGGEYRRTASKYYAA